MKEKDEQIKNIVEQIKALPDEMQKAIYWLIQNIEIADQLSEGTRMTDEEIEQFTQRALARRDYVMLVLIKYKQFKNQMEAKDSEQGTNH